MVNMETLYLTVMIKSSYCRLGFWWERGSVIKEIYDQRLLRKQFLFCFDCVFLEGKHNTLLVY